MTHMTKWLMLLTSAICFAACCPKVYPTMQKTDSVRVEYRERIIIDTAYIEIHREAERTVTRDTSSRLENTYALSEAAITDGLLYHSLETKPQTVKAPVKMVVRDTIYVERQSESETIVEVRNELTKSQKRMIAGFWMLLVAFIATLAWKIYRVFHVG